MPRTLLRTGWLAMLLGCGEEPSFALPELSGEVSDAGVVWNGSHTRWTYNHRINRLGSTIGSTDCDDDGACVAVVKHGAASGSGDDVAAVRGFHTVVQSDELSFLQGVVAFELSGERTEHDVVARLGRVKLAIEDARLDRAQHVAVLGGFDLASISDPDKLQQLSLAISPVLRDGDILSFDVSVSAVLDCDSPECTPFDKSIDYQLVVVWTLIAADDAVELAEQRIEHDYSWDADDREDEPHLDDHRVAVGFAGSGGDWATAVPALRSLSVKLDDDHHMVSWAAAARLDDFDGASGAADLTADLFFQQWNQETWDRLLSYTSPGDARWSADLVLVRLGEGCAEAGETTGELAWEADGSAATDEASVIEFEVAGTCR